MSDLSMGQRIAIRRKLKNLSQEALAEQLEVSRQAVSKWESDISIPEVDKLITLGKIFGVSVGWLLGTEQEAADVQLQAEEENRIRNLPKKQSRLPWMVYLVLTAIVVAFFYSNSMTSADAATEFRLESLQTQIDDLNEMLSAHIEEGNILSDSYFTAIAAKGMRKAEVTFYFIPKVYRETDDAYLVIGYQDETSALRDITLCQWTGTRYTVTVELERLNGYTFAFRLVNDSGFQEQNLLRGGLADSDVLVNLDNSMGFHISPDHPKYTQMQKQEPEETDGNLQTYTYNAPILTPRIFPKNACGYQDIQILLRKNEDVIWQESYLNAFMKLTNGECTSTEALPLDISVELPKLSSGDELVLELVAELTDGTVLLTPLDWLSAQKTAG